MSNNHGSNLTSRFGMNENMATDADRGNTVVGGAFAPNDTTGRTGDSYVHGVQAHGGRGLDAVGDQNELSSTTGNRTHGTGGIPPGGGKGLGGMIVPGSGTGAGSGHVTSAGGGAGADYTGEEFNGSRAGTGAGAGLTGAAASAGQHGHHGHSSTDRPDRFDRSKADVPQEDFSITDKVKNEVNKTKNQAQEATPDDANVPSGTGGASRDNNNDYESNSRSGDYNTNDRSNLTSGTTSSSSTSDYSRGENYNNQGQGEQTGHGVGTHGIGMRSSELSGDSEYKTPAAGVPTGRKVWTGEPSGEGHTGGDGDLCETKGFMGRDD